jgi:hypothetical protein
MSHFHFNQHILSAAAITIISGCSSSDRSTPPAVKPQTHLAPASAAVQVAPASVADRVALAFAAGAPSIPTLTVPDLGPPGDPSAARAALGDPSVVAKLRGLALQVSSLAGVSSPMTMLAVAADHQAAEKVLCGAIVNDHAPVYVIKMTGGPFTSRRHSPAGPAPQGNVLTLTVNAATYRITDVGYDDVEPDLSQIGPVAVNLR